MSRRKKVSVVVAIASSLALFFNPKLIDYRRIFGTDTQFRDNWHAEKRQLVLTTNAGKQEVRLSLKLECNDEAIKRADVKFVRGNFHELDSAEAELDAMDDDGRTIVYESGTAKQAPFTWRTDVPLLIQWKDRTEGEIELTDWQVLLDSGPKDSKSCRFWRRFVQVGICAVAFVSLVGSIRLILLPEDDQAGPVPIRKVTRDDIVENVIKVISKAEPDEKVSAMIEELLGHYIQGVKVPVSRIDKWRKKKLWILWFSVRPQFQQRLREFDPLGDFRRFL